MKRIRYTLLLGMLMMGMTAITAWSQPTIMITEKTPISVTFHFGTGTTSISFFVTPGDAPPSSADPVRVINRMADSDVTATVKGLTPATLYTIHYIETGVVTVTRQMFTTASLSLDFLFELIESRTELFETEVAAHDTRITMLESHAHADLESQSHMHVNKMALDDHSHAALSANTHGHPALTAQSHEHDNKAELDLHSHATLTASSHTHTNQVELDAQSHTHTNQTELDAQSHMHADLMTLESQPHAHANLAALNAHSHTGLAMQTHTHTEVPTHTHEGDDDGGDDDGRGGITGLPNEHSRLAFLPNPTEGTFTLRGMDGYERIEIYDAGGRVVHMQTKGLSIDLGGYPAGTYIARVHMRHGVHTRQLIKK